jgi:hypothetical protein
MAASIHPQRLNHMNAVLRDFDASVTHFCEGYGAEFVVDIPQKEFHACLIALGGAILELFVPHDFLVSARLGPHYVGVEWQADMDKVRAALADHKVGLVRDIGLALHTDPADCFGVSYEFYAGEFHTREWDLLGGPIKPAAYWRDQHPMGLSGLRGYTHMVEDLGAAGAFLKSFLGGELVSAERRPEVAAQAHSFRVADVRVELLAADGEGWLRDQLRRQGQGILSTVFGARELGQARGYCIAHGIPLDPGSARSRIAVPAAANRGILFEFSE